MITLRKTLFWDIDLDKLDLVQQQDFVIARVLEEGSSQDIKWLFLKYSQDDIARVVRQSRSLSPRTANFWRYRLNIKEPIVCLSKPFIQRRARLWKN